MGLIIRQSIKASIFSYIGICIGFVNTIFFFPKFLGEANIGIIETIKAIVLLLSPFAIFGIIPSVIKFFPNFSIKGKDDGFYATLGLMLLLWLSLFFLLITIFTDEISNFFGYSLSEIEEYAWLVYPSLFCLVLFNFLSAISSSSMRITVPRIMESVLLRVLILVLVLLFGYSYISLYILVVLFSFLNIVPITILFIYSIKLKMIKWKINTTLFKKENLKSVFKYSRYAVFGAATSVIVQKIDILMIASTENLSSVGVYAIAFYIGSVIEIPKRNISDISFPILSQAFKDGNLNLIENIYKKSSINQFIIGSLLLIIVWTCLDNLFMIMPEGDSYRSGKYVVLFIGLAKLFDMLMGVNKQIIQASGFYKYNLYINILLSVLVVIFNLIFIPMYSIAGAALSSMFAIIIYNLVSYLIVWKQLKMQPLTMATFKLLLLVVTIFVVGVFLPDFSSAILSILYKAILLSLFYVLVVYYLKISPQVNEVIDSFILRIRS